MQNNDFKQLMNGGESNFIQKAKHVSAFNSNGGVQPIHIWKVYTLSALTFLMFIEQGFWSFYFLNKGWKIRSNTWSWVLQEEPVVHFNCAFNISATNANHCKVIPKCTPCTRDGELVGWGACVENCCAVIPISHRTSYIIMKSKEVVPKWQIARVGQFTLLFLWVKLLHSRMLWPL